MPAPRRKPSKARRTSGRRPVRRRSSAPRPACAYLQSLYDRMCSEDQLYLLTRTVDHSPVAVMVTTPQGLIEYVNRRFSQISGRQVKQLTGQRLPALARTGAALWGTLWDKVRAQGVWQGELQPTGTEPSAGWGSVSIQPVRNRRGQVTNILVFLEDITRQKQSEAMIEHLAHYDSLTDLPNREHFHVRLTAALETAKKQGYKVGVAIVGLDRFKLINNTLGHSAGDRVIRSVGHRLRDQVDDKTVIARMGGDEFILLFPQVSHFRQATLQCQEILNAFTQPFQVDEQEVYIKASMGVSLFPEDGQDSLLLIKNADAALNEAKQTGRNHLKFYTAKLDAAAAPEQLFIETSLRQALDREEFVVYYQPQVNFATNQIVGWEALLRWQHPKLGLLAPDKFITLAEETGLIVPLGLWALRTACRQVRHWHLAGFPDLKIAVNLSARQILEPELVEAVLGICREVDLDPKFLELEITESIFMEDSNVTKMILQWLRKKGASIAIDDFGTGYSSLTYLKQFPISVLKIDRSFVKECLSNPDDAAIVATIVSIARNLDLQLIAEGVETEEQLHFLQSLGCQVFQGFLFARPLPAAECLPRLRAGLVLPAPRPA
jgi:diguanylate cyclase (GGDEF)-like protein/PAS domain S-box-containing protein